VNSPLRYSWRALLPDYAGGTVGLVCTFGPLALAQPAAVVAGALAAAGALFLVYFSRTVCRQLTQFEVDEAGIRANGPFGAAIRWEDLRSLRLDYYSTRRDAEGRTMQGGWMQLRLRDARHTIRIGSELDGFAALVRAAALAAARSGAELDAATRANLGALGIEASAARTGETTG